MKKLGLKPYIIWIAWHYLVSSRRRKGLGFMAVMSVTGVALGVGALIVVLSVMGGFEQDLNNKMLRGQPHLEIVSQTAAAGFSLKSVPVEKISKLFPEALDVEPFVQSDVVIKQGKHIVSATIFGVDPKRQGHLWGFNDAMTEGDMKDIGNRHVPLISEQGSQGQWPGIIMGEDLAISLSADVGDVITVVSPYATKEQTALTGGTLTRQYVVVGTFRTGMFNYDAKWAVVSLEEGRKFMADYDTYIDEEQFVTGIALNLKDPHNMEGLEQRLQPFEGLTALSWQKVNSSLLFALKLEKYAMGSIMMLIVLVASFSISGTSMMTVYYKRSQISLLRSLGMSRVDISKLFLTHGLIIGSCGVLLGFIGGVGLCFLIDYFRFIKLPSHLYALAELQVKFLPSNYLVICLFAWCFSIVASMYPALTAARQDPSSGLR